MTKVKFCGVSRPCDIEAANELRPEYVGFVFATGSHRCITPEKAKELKLVGLKGHREVGGLRASTYNALPMESVQVLADLMKDFVKKQG